MAPEPPVAGPVGLSDYIEGYLVEDDTLVAARTLGAQLGCAPVGAATGAALRFLAAALRAKAVVEVGTGVGVSGLHLLRGMAPDGVLTSIDVEPEVQAVAKRTFRQAGVPPGRTRLIMGRALDVLPRLSDGGYDLLFVDAAATEYPAFHEHGVRLLRPGGVLAFDSVLYQGNIANPARRDAETLALREVVRAVREDDRLVPLLLPLGDGLLLAAKIA
ncbi:putative O-methyltransferase YrrM [Actinokineospora baliensis]|uniref:O-methyltransferase n=1 Tax=Actinokineospora baliensis TaxID=547056 RepID=UPI00195F0A44|nr:class I SAM-dependent methyltransferase [Actinokineospora baliensis]MBM7772054.1 putative O-methyltransferase YrrM [Actinokineospora baliensis]